MSKLSYKLIIYLITLLLIYSGLAYSIDKGYLDSIEKIYKTSKNKKEKLNSLYTLTYEYGLFNPKKGIEIGQKLLKEAKAENDSIYILKAYNGMANCYETMMKYDSALYLNELGYTLIKNTRWYNMQYSTLCNIALCHKKLGHYNLAIQYYNRAAKCIENRAEHNPRYYYYLCELYMRIDNVAKAKEIVLSGLRRCELGAGTDQKEYFKNILFAYLGNCYARQAKPDSAFYFLTKSVQGLKKETDTIAQANALAFMADAHQLFGKYDSAIYYYNKSIQLYHKLNNKPLENFTLIKLVYTKSFKNSYVIHELENTLKKVLQNLNSFESNYDLLLDIYTSLSKDYERLKDYKAALFYSKQADNLSRIILDREQRLTFMDFEKSYETLKREKKIEELKNTNKITELELENKESSLNRYFIIIIAIAIIFFVSIIFFIQFYKKKKALMKAKHELSLHELKLKERNRISKDLHDDIGSGLNRIYFLGEMILKQEKAGQEASSLVEKMKGTSQQLISNMRDMIWVLDEENQQIETLIARIREYAYDYLEEKNIELTFNSQIDTNDEIKSIEMVRTMISIIKEILSNIFKHSQATMVTMEFNKNGDELMLITEDNGVGFNGDVKYGNGIKNMRSRAQEIAAEIIIESKKAIGTKTTLIFNL